MRDEKQYSEDLEVCLVTDLLEEVHDEPVADGLAHIDKAVLDHLHIRTVSDTVDWRDNSSQTLHETKTPEDERPGDQHQGEDVEPQHATHEGDSHLELLQLLCLHVHFDFHLSQTSHEHTDPSGNETIGRSRTPVANGHGIVNLVGDVNNTTVEHAHLIVNLACDMNHTLVERVKLKINDLAEVFRHIIDLRVKVIARLIHLGGEGGKDLVEFGDRHYYTGMDIKTPCLIYSIIRNVCACLLTGGLA
jgi:hypothetical protein